VKNLAKILSIGVVLVFFGLNGQHVMANSAPQGVSELKSISYQEADKQLQVMIKVQGNFSFEIFELRQPNRLVLDLTSVGKISSEPSLQINELGVLTVRAGQFQPGVARVVFDLDEKSPLHRISQVEDGVKVIFWQEGTPAPAQAKEEAVEVKKKEPPAKKETLTEAKKIKPAKTAVRETAPTVGKERSFFVQLGGGIGIPLSSTTQIQKDLILYGETGSYSESYKLKSSPLFELGVGKYMKVGEKGIRLTLGLGYSQFKYTETLDLTIPHPFVPDSPRTVSAADELKNNLYYFYLSGTYPVLTTDKLSLWVGPVLGYASGKYTSLQDFSIEDNPPYTSADVTISSMTHVDETISSLLVGGLVNLEYLVGSNISLNLDCRLVYFSPKVNNLNLNVKLSSLQFLLGLKYDF